MRMTKKLMRVLLLALTVDLCLRFIDCITDLKLHRLKNIASLKTDVVVREETFNVESTTAEASSKSVPDEALRSKEKVSGNLPLDFLERNPNRKLNDTCALLPSAFDIHFNNVIWQTLTTNDSNFYLYNAYYDNRVLEENRPVVRMTAIINYKEAIPQTACQLWFTEQDAPVLSEATYDYLWHAYWNIKNQRGFLPYLVSCQIPKTHSSLVPKAVSLVERPCDFATNVLKVLYDLPESGEKEDFSVCVKATDFFFSDTKARLVEWLELLSILGVGKVFFYDFGMNEETSKVMKYYEERGKVEVLRVTLPGSQPNILGLYFQYVRDKDLFQHEVIQFQDCYFRSIYRYKYTVHLDVDEIIIPRKADTWKGLMTAALRKAANHTIDYTSFCSREVFYMDSMLPPEGKLEGIPSHMHILRHIIRSANMSEVGDSCKCFHDTEQLKAIHHHFPILRIDGKFPETYHIDIEDGWLQHYRSQCQPFITNCFERFQKHVLYDTRIWNFKGKLIQQVTDTFSNLTLE